MSDYVSRVMQVLSLKNCNLPLLQKQQGFTLDQLIKY